MTRWWWIRHAPVPGLAPGEIVGQRDLDADVADPAPAAALAEELPAGALALVSPLKRARQTLAALGAVGFTPAETATDPGFQEQDFGSWAGQRWDSLGADLPFWSDPATIAPPDGESFAHCTARVGAAMERWAEARPEAEDIVVIAHGGPVRAALAEALGIPPDSALRFVVDTWSLTRLERVERGIWRVVSVNRRSTS